MGTILGKGFPQALVRTVHSTCACGKLFPKIVPMAKIDIPLFYFTITNVMPLLTLQQK